MVLIYNNSIRLKLDMHNINIIWYFMWISIFIDLHLKYYNLQQIHNTYIYIYIYI